MAGNIVLQFGWSTFLQQLYFFSGGGGGGVKRGIGAGREFAILIGIFFL